MFKKSYYIILDFYKSIRLGEFIESIIIPLVFTLLAFATQDGNLNNELKTSFNDSVLTITSFLIAFSICAITLLFSTSSQNIEDAKKQITERKNHRNKKVSYFQLIQIRSYYNVCIEFLLIVLTIFYKLFSEGLNLNALFYVNIFLIVHILFVLCFVVIHMYHLSWRNE